MAKTSAEIETRAAKGGRARAAAMTADERTESARRAVRARWAKRRSPRSVQSVQSIQPIQSVSASTGMPERAETQYFTIIARPPTEPLLSTEVWS